MNRQEFTIFINSSQQWLRRFLASLCCGDNFVVDEVAQETYIKAYLSMNKIKDEKKSRAWLLKIAYHTFLNYIRDNQSADSKIEEIVSKEACQLSDSSFKYETLYNALNSLPPKERISVILFYLEGYSCKEISSLLDTKEANVRQAISRGRNKLRSLLQSN